MTVPRTDPRAASRQGLPGSMPGSPPPERRGPRATLLWVLAPLLCCGGPLLLAVLATASAATRGAVGGAIGALLLAVALAVWVRRRRRVDAGCCPPAGGAWRQ